MRDTILKNIKHLKDGRELLINTFRDRIFSLSDPRFYPQYREDGSDSSDDESDGGNGGNGNNGGSSRNGGSSGSNNSDDSSGSNNSDHSLRPPRNGNNTGASTNDSPVRNGNNRGASTEEKEALKKVGIIDSSLEPGLVKKYFKDESSTDMFLKIKSSIRIEARNIKMAIIKSGLISLKNDMKNMSENEIKNRRLDVLLMFIEELLNKLQGESQEDLAFQYRPPRYFKKQGGDGLKIMIPNQLLTTFTILPAQKQAGNNSQKLNNEIRHIIYSLHISKNMSKTVYNHLMNSI